MLSRLMCLIGTVELQDLRLGAPDHGSRALRLGPGAMVLARWIHLEKFLLAHFLYSCANFKLNRTATRAEWRQLMNAHI